MQPSLDIVPHLLLYLLRERSLSVAAHRDLWPIQGGIYIYFFLVLFLLNMFLYSFRKTTSNRKHAI